MFNVFAMTIALAHFKSVKVVSVYDGDTFTANIPNVPSLFGQAIPVRVSGVDTAEMKSSGCEAKMALKAKRRSQELLKHARHIDLLNVRRDKYFRLLADVLIDGKSLGKTLLDEKLAVPYDGMKKTNVDWCKEN